MKESSGILLTTGDRWLLAERSERVKNPLVWSVPGGGVPRDRYGQIKPVLPSAVREFHEEMGRLPHEMSLRGKLVHATPK